MYTLGVHTGHDAGACLFRDLELVAFCKEERVSRVKNDGGVFDLLSVNEVLKIAGISRKQIDAVAFTRMGFPLECFRQTSKPIKDFVRQTLGKNVLGCWQVRCESKGSGMKKRFLNIPL